MKNRRLSFCLVLSVFTYICIAGFTQTNAAEAGKYIKPQKLTDRVLMVSLGYDVITAVESDGGIVVIDAGISNSLTAKYRTIIEKEFNRKDFAYLINTHSHWDHIGGNQVFSDAVIIGHHNCLVEMALYWKDPDKVKAGALKTIENYEAKLKSADFDSLDKADFVLQKIRYKSVYNDLLNDRIVTTPSVTFQDQMNINLEDMTLNLIYFGRAHTGSDIMIHIPEEKLLMAGDLFSEGGRPHFRKYTKQDTERWMSAKQWIEERLDSIEIVIGGHGEIMGREDLIGFFKRINELHTE